MIKNINEGDNIELFNGEEILISRATVRDIARNCFIIVLPPYYCKTYGNNCEHYLQLQGVTPEVFFQILANNYSDNYSKLDWLNFFARHANQDGFLNMAQTQFITTAISKGIKINRLEQKTHIFLDKQIDSNIKLSEYFKIQIDEEEDFCYLDTATIELQYTINVNKDPKIELGNLIVNAQDYVVDRILDILGQYPTNHIHSLNHQYLINSQEQLVNFWDHILSKQNTLLVRQQPKLIAQHSHSYKRNDLSYIF